MPKGFGIPITIGSGIPLPKPFTKTHGPSWKTQWRYETWPKPFTPNKHHHTPELVGASGFGSVSPDLLGTCYVSGNLSAAINPNP